MRDGSVHGQQMSESTYVDTPVTGRRHLVWLGHEGRASLRELEADKRHAVYPFFLRSAAVRSNRDERVEHRQRDVDVVDCLPFRRIRYEVEQQFVLLKIPFARLVHLTSDSRGQAQKIFEEMEGMGLTSDSHLFEYVFNVESRLVCHAPAACLLVPTITEVDLGGRGRLLDGRDVECPPTPQRPMEHVDDASIGLRPAQATVRRGVGDNAARASEDIRPKRLSRKRQ